MSKQTKNEKEPVRRVQTRKITQLTNIPGRYSKEEYKRLIEKGIYKQSSTKNPKKKKANEEKRKEEHKHIIPLNELDEETRKLFEKEKERLSKAPGVQGLSEWKPTNDTSIIQLPKKRDFIPIVMMKHFKRPYFSPVVNSYEVDLVFIEDDKVEVKKKRAYAFIININTRKLYAIPIGTKDKHDLKTAFQRLISSGVQINNLRSDGESGLNSKEVKDFFEQMGIKYWSSTSKYTQKSRIIDRAIKRIRDGMEVSPRKNGDTFEEYLQRIVAFYNNAYHSGIGMTPNEMNYEDEHEYIERCKEKLMLAKKVQHLYGFHNYQQNEKLHIYLDLRKTPKRFKKVRSYYTREARFIRYVNGNVECEVDGENIIIPIYHTLSDKVKEKLMKYGYAEAIKENEKFKDKRDEETKKKDAVAKRMKTLQRKKRRNERERIYYKKRKVSKK